MANVPDVVAAIFNASSNARVRTSMTFGSGLEAGWSDTAHNPSGATGPFQILLPVHPDISFSQAEDPVAATNYMLGAYQSAVAQVSPGLWNSNPEVAAEQTVITAEQPGGPFPSTTPTDYGQEGVDVVNQRWGQTVNMLQGQWNPGSNITLPPPGQGGSASTTSALGGASGNLGFWEAVLSGPQGISQWLAQHIANSATGDIAGGLSATKLLGSLYDLIKDPIDTIERGALILFGGVIILIGLFVMAQNTSPGRAATQIAGAGITGGASRVRGLASGSSQDRTRRLELSSRALDIGERKVQVQEQRQARLSANAALKAPAVGRHRRNTGP